MNKLANVYSNRLYLGSTYLIAYIKDNWDNKKFAKQFILSKAAASEILVNPNLEYIVSNILIFGSAVFEENVEVL